MKLIKLSIVLWGVFWFVGLLVASPGNVFALVILTVLYFSVALTIGSPDYWRRYHKHVHGDASTHNRTNVQ